MDLEEDEDDLDDDDDLEDLDDLDEKEDKDAVLALLPTSLFFVVEIDVVPYLLENSLINFV